MNWLAEFERSHPNLIVHELGIRGLYAVTHPDDRRIAIVTQNNGRIILTKEKAKALCENLLTIMELFARP